MLTDGAGRGWHSRLPTVRLVITRPRVGGTRSSLAIDFDRMIPHDTGDSPVRRFAMTALTLSLMIGLSTAQEPKKEDPKP